MKKKLTALFIPALMLLCGIYLFPLQIVQSDFSQIPGDFGDARFNNYILEHGHQFLTGKVPSFWDAQMMYPLKNVVAYSDNLLGTLPIYSLLRISGLDRETAFQGWFVILFALNFICCYIVLTKWSGNIYLAASGAYLFAFSIFILGQTNNLQNHPRFAIPFIIYFGWQYFHSREIKFFLITSILVVYQFYCGMYLGFFVVYSIFFMLLAYLLVYKDWQIFSQFKKSNVLLPHLGALTLSIFLLLLLMLPYLEIHKETGYRTFEEIEGTIPHIQSYFFSSNSSLIWGIFSEHAIDNIEMWWCHIMFTGMLPWIAIALSPVILFSKKISRSSKLFLTFLLTVLFLNVIFSLNFNGISLYYYIYNIPGFGSLRSINRVINTEVIFFSLILVFVFNAFLSIKPALKKIIILLPMLVVFDNLIIGENVTQFAKAECIQKVNEMESLILSHDAALKKPIAYLPVIMPEKYFETQLTVMLACQKLGVPCVNGYSGSTPSALVDFVLTGDMKSLMRWSGQHNLNIDSLTLVYEEGPGVILKEKIYLKASNGKYLSSDHSNGDKVLANQINPSDWETFTLVKLIEQKCALLDNNHKFVCPELMSSGELNATRSTRKSWETFKLFEIDNKSVAFKADNGKFVTLDDASLQLFATSDTIGKNETFHLIEK